MRINRLREVWARSGVVINGWLGIPSAVAAENMAQAGWDSLTCDLQHGLLDYADALAMLQAISTTATTPLARVPWNEPGIIMKLLDAGALGIICPMVNNRAQCEAFVGACRYAPQGYRSYGPTRALWYAGADYLQHANSSVVALAMIETQQAVRELDAILDTQGLDGIYIGPSDLGLSLGCEARLDPVDPTVVATIKAIVDKARQRGLHAGLHCATTAYARQAIAWGCDMVTTGTDNVLLNQAARRAVSDMRA